MKCRARCGAGFSVLVAASLTYAVDFYVSPSGSDANAGTIAQPFATITKAQEAVRTAKAGGGDINVYLRGGIYTITSPLTFTQADGGAGAQNITYQAYPGECVTISGGRQITGWTKGSGNLWTADIPDVKSGAWYFRELFINEKRMPRGKFPNGPVSPGGVMKVTAATDMKNFTVSQAVSQNLAGKDAEAVNFMQWSIGRAIIASNSGSRITTVSVIGHSDHSGYTDIAAGDCIYLENALSFVDQPGEWYLDRASGSLTYMAAANEDPNTESCIAPFSEKLLIVRGANGSPVQGLHFIGIKFQYSKWTFPVETGYVPMQTGVFDVNTRATPTYIVPLALDFQWTEGCTVERCRIAHIGQTGIGFGLGCRHSKVTGCEIVDVAGHGCDIGHPGDTIHQSSWQVNVTDQQAKARGNEISNCYVHNCGAVFFDCVGIFSLCTDSTTISRNEVTDMPYTGIAFGFNWGSTAGTIDNCLVANNHAHDLVHILGDGGGIYSLASQPHSLVIGNYVHHIWGSVNNPTCVSRYCGAVGLYYDQGSDYTSQNNIVYDVEIPTASAPNAGVREVNNFIEWQPGPVTDAQKAPYYKSAGLDSSYSWLVNPSYWSTCATVAALRPAAPQACGIGSGARSSERTAVFTLDGRRLAAPLGTIRAAGLFIVRPEGGAGGPLVLVVNVDRR